MVERMVRSPEERMAPNVKDSLRALAGIKGAEPLPAHIVEAWERVDKWMRAIGRNYWKYHDILLVMAVAGDAAGLELPAMEPGTPVNVAVGKGMPATFVGLAPDGRATVKLNKSGAVRHFPPELVTPTASEKNNGGPK